MYNYTKVDPQTCDFVTIAALDDLANGERMFVEIDDQRLVLFNIAGQLFAIADVCSHDDGPLGDGELKGLEIVCPRHGASFDVGTGKALTLPAVIDIAAFPVRVVDGQIEVGLPLNAV